MLEQLCPVYMAMGMSYDEYWNGDPCAVRAYREADRIRRQRASDDAWLQGYYIYEAIGSLVPALNPMTKKGVKVKDYRKEPIRLFAHEEDNRRERQEAKQMNIAKARLQAFADQFNRDFRKRAAAEGVKKNADND